MEESIERSIERSVEDRYAEALRKFDKETAEKLTGIIARRIYDETRSMNLPRAPLYDGSTRNKLFKKFPQGPIARRMAELLKKNTTSAAELQALLAARNAL